MNKIGSRAKVMHGNALKTGGGLTKKELKYNNQGKIVSIKASNSAKNSNNLIKSGFYTKKGIFGAYQKGGSKLIYNLLEDDINIFTQNLLSPYIIGSTLFHNISNIFIKTYDNDLYGDRLRISKEILDTIDIKYKKYCHFLIEFIESNYNVNLNADEFIKLNICLDIIINTKFKLICNTYDKLEFILKNNTKLIFMLQEIDYIYQEMINDILNTISNSDNIYNINYGTILEKNNKSNTQCIICKNLNCKSFEFLIKNYKYKGNQSPHPEFLNIPSLLLIDYNIIVSSIHVPAFLSEVFTKSAKEKSKKPFRIYFKNLYSKIYELKQIGFNVLIGGDFNRLLHLKSQINNDNSNYSIINEIIPTTPTGFPIFIENRKSNQIDNYPGIDGFIVTDEKHDYYTAYPVQNEFIKHTFINNPYSKNYAISKKNKIENLNNSFIRNIEDNYSGSDHLLVKLNFKHIYCNHENCLTSVNTYLNYNSLKAHKHNNHNNNND